MLRTGEKVPDFIAKDQKGKEVTSEYFKGKKTVLFFYPRDLTEACIKEACNLRDHYSRFKKMGFEIVGVSADDEKTHRKFIDKYKLPFRLIADTEKDIITKFGVWGPKKFMGREFDGILRSTFLINEQGIITHRFDKVITKSHSEQILAELNKQEKK